jgi:glycosyltransferase involved in cell wall biosynthesis
MTTVRSEQAPSTAGGIDLPELSVILPCLNEEDTLATCLETARRTLAANGIRGEIVVADNGSTDGSRSIAERFGARVVEVSQKGYGAALMGGIAASRGRFVIMGDADASYDFAEIPRFLGELRKGAELVQGCRLASGGGRVMPGAMPWLHRWLGNPLFSWLARRWFRAPVHDIHSGMRGFTRQLYDSLDQRCTGMEFASEMIIKSTLQGARIAEVPITLHPDGRRAHAPHLRTFRDGWRHLRFFLLFSPRWLFLVPGGAMIALGVLGYALGMPAMKFGRVGFDVHTILFGSLAIICGYQSILFAILTKAFAMSEGLLPQDARFRRFFELVNLERGVAVGAAAMLAGLILLGAAVNEWRQRGFGALDYRETMRVTIPGVTLTALGFQTVLFSFFASILGMRRR